MCWCRGSDGGIGAGAVVAGSDIVLASKGREREGGWGRERGSGGAVRFMLERVRFNDYSPHWGLA